MPAARFDLKKILNQAYDYHALGRDEIKFLLGLSDPDQIKQLFKTARQVREAHFGNQVFLYGFLYFSTYCRNACSFCQYRKSNTDLPRYRKTPNQILAAAMEMADTGVHLIDLTMGEDPQFYRPDAMESSNPSGTGFEQIVKIVQIIQKQTRTPVMISAGTLPKKVLSNLSDAGASWYACYQETHSPDLYKQLRPGQDFEKRLRQKAVAKNLGMLVEEGILTGVGETLDDIVGSILWMKDFDVDQARVMTFVPQPDTPMGDIIAQDSLTEQIIIAVMRLALPDRLIPASLDVDGLSGLKARLDAGANVVTSIVPPHKGLAGVANHSLDIDDSRRTLDQIIPVLTSSGLAPASREEYNSWVKKRQQISRKPVLKKEIMAC